MATYADVLPVVGRSFPLLLTYSIPDGMADRLETGSQVLISLSGRTAAGYVVSLHDRRPEFENILPVEAVLDAPLVFTPRELELARWMAEYYCCPLSQALRPFLSEVGAVRVRRQLRLTEHGRKQLEAPADTLKEETLRALEMLRERKGKISRRALAAVSGARRVSALLRALKEQGLVEETASVVSPGGEKRDTLVSLAVGAEQALETAEKISLRAPRQAAVLSYLARLKSAGRTAGTGSAEVLLSEVVRKTESLSAVRALERKGLVKTRHIPHWRTPWPDAPTDHPCSFELNPQQKAALDKILKAIQKGGSEVFLLFGVTGSGKTEIFLRAIAEALSKGKQALLLVPEISLTAQVVGLLRARFGNQVAVIHSALSSGERRDEKERVRLREARVVMGPRSALFSPFDDLGVVVVDEEHDNSYKQEQEPRYHAREVARKLAEQSGCPCVLASATPSLESFYLAQKGAYRLLRLEERPEGRPLPEVHLLDMKGKSRRSKILLPELRQALTSCLETDTQAILFLNRRGHSTFLFCPLCGHAFRCPHCQVALIYHAQGKLLRCHHCDHTMGAPETCPNCMGATLRFAGFGTQRLARELEELFPAARVSRMDRDTTSLKGAHLRIISDFRAAATDLLVGTQMVSKGLHFPGVTVVGVVAADMSLNTPDFRAAERTFQLLTQVAGRAGRGEESGEVFVQTYHPDHYAIQAASRHDYEAFCEEELKMREEA
ncbi:MAG: primosomal protein N', partial [Armatimonadetes bacterium]|nr:primosomal protein N' [Armatimonadota bacterium]NIM24467.1 primosomal protein N' [Armatimonadota bacterium]NIM68338.1 primosomal protein N' [Armatimonadota bacterium]NIM76742.1 primosomal protein N' [Armatimonadota bacterium]NIN06541.1 primosomal protein N' [Armatimonadota bacterium]